MWQFTESWRRYVEQVMLQQFISTNTPKFQSLLQNQLLTTVKAIVLHVHLPDNEIRRSQLVLNQQIVKCTIYDENAMGNGMYLTRIMDSKKNEKT